MDQNNKYTKMQRDQYNAGADEMAIENHRPHDLNPDYYGLLLKKVKDNPEIWKEKLALDFGCGAGRNIDNLLRLTTWAQVDGCDISIENINRTEKYLLECGHYNFNLYTTTGIDLQPIIDTQYDFVMSTIVLQHISVHSIRTSIFNDIYRVMKTGGLFSFQMAQYDIPHGARYYEDAWDIGGTNGVYDVSVDNPQFLMEDLNKIGYKNISFIIRPEWDPRNKCYMTCPWSRWIYIEAYK